MLSAQGLVNASDYVRRALDEDPQFLGGPWGGFGAHVGSLGGPLGGPRGGFGDHFGDLGVPLGAFGAQSAPKTLSPDPPALHFRGFWCPKGGQKDPKMELRSMKNRFEIQSNF